MAYASDYVWVVICKNHNYHKKQNLFFGHKISLGETDALHPAPALPGAITVNCDDCGHQNTYKPSELMRLQLELPESFQPHPEFL